MRFLSYIYVSAALMWAAYANPLPHVATDQRGYPNDEDVSTPSVRADIITELDLAAARNSREKKQRASRLVTEESRTAAGVLWLKQGKLRGYNHGRAMEDAHPEMYV
ncbi:hypothetical protein B0H17DRAFT_1200366 [Mycena rosella]|uniref:Uncharacterized protein n=1 Tax=Mycena rosella TaxID=1033263 RepID=A0AAD7DJ76_MYCRO|nr:hypothetical protein B0H17DRAFT_1200366 [Mycena rosella]